MFWFFFLIRGAKRDLLVAVYLTFFPPDYYFSEAKNVSSVDVTQSVFNNLNRDKAYEFILQSYNSVGYSPNSSLVFLPMSANSKSENGFVLLFYSSVLIRFVVFPLPQCPQRRRTS